MEQKTLQIKLQQSIKIARTGEHPNKINQRAITAIQKPGKIKGPIENLTPIFLSSILIKILEITLKQHMMHKLDVKILSSQAVYRRKEYHLTCFHYNDIGWKNNGFIKHSTQQTEL